MAHGIAGIDHALLGVRDLEAARANWQRLGFTLTPRGRHIGWGTGNYCIMFPGSYVELLGIVRADEFDAGLGAQLAARGEGLLKLALATPDAAGAHAALAASGYAVAPAQSLKRRLELPEREALPAFALVHLPDDAVPGLPLFLCQHLTPELVWQPAWLAHANGARRLAAVTVVVERPAALQAPCERLFGAGATAMTDETLTVFTGREAILFVTPADLETMHPETMEAPPQPPWIAAMTFAVADLGRTQACLEQAGIAHRRGEDGALRVPARAANGAILEFAAAADARSSAQLCDH